ncbi:MAG: MAPEG family protein [Hyphomicrobiales bacterium]|nr:MAPEG family protein [Hyphomicrobiales bacterium]
MKTDALETEKTTEEPSQPGRIMGRGPLGFSRKTWPFVKVLVGNWIFSLSFYIGAKQVIPWTPLSWNVGDRLSLMIECAVVAASPAVVAIIIVAAQRLNPDMWVGQRVRPNSSLDINTRFILNTVEQFILFLVGLSGIALYAPMTEAHSVPILTALFLMGRALFWIGYHKNPYLRAFGFGITFYPTVAVFVWVLVRLTTGYQIPI